MAKVAEYPGQPSEVEVFREVSLATFVCSGISFHLLLDERINFVRVLHVTQMGFANFLVWLRSNKRQVISQSFLPFFLLCNTLTYSTPFIASKLRRKSFFISFRRVINSKYFFPLLRNRFCFHSSRDFIIFFREPVIDDSGNHTSNWTIYGAWADSVTINDALESIFSSPLSIFHFSHLRQRDWLINFFVIQRVLIKLLHINT